MAQKTQFDGLTRFRKTTEEAAQRAMAEANGLVEEARTLVRGLEARLYEGQQEVIDDVSMLATHEAALTRLREEIRAAHEALTVAQQTHRAAQSRLQKAAGERRAAERLQGRAQDEQNKERRRKERRDEDEIAQHSGEGLPET